MWCYTHAFFLLDVEEGCGAFSFWLDHTRLSQLTKNIGTGQSYVKVAAGSSFVNKYYYVQSSFYETDGVVVVLDFMWWVVRLRRNLNLV